MISCCSPKSRAMRSASARCRSGCWRSRTGRADPVPAWPRTPGRHCPRRRCRRRSGWAGRQAVRRAHRVCCPRGHARRRTRRPPDHRPVARASLVVILSGTVLFVIRLVVGVVEVVVVFLLVLVLVVLVVVFVVRGLE